MLSNNVFFKLGSVTRNLPSLALKSSMMPTFACEMRHVDFTDLQELRIWPVIDNVPKPVFLCL